MESSILAEKERTLFFRYMIPSMLSMLTVSAYSFVDTFVVAQAIGAQAVAAMGLGTPVVSIFFALGYLCGCGGAVLYAVKTNAGDKEQGREIFTCAVAAAMVLWIVIAVAGNLFIRQLAVFLGATSGNIDLTVSYLRWIISLSGILIMDLVMNNFMRNEGHPNVSMVATVTGTSVNIVLDFLFVMVFGWGMGGAASATCTASIISVIINLVYAVVNKTNLRLCFRMADIKNLWPMIKIGFGTFALEGAVAVISVVFLNFAGKYYGDDGVSAFSVLITFNLVVYSLLNGVAEAMQPLISANYGAGKPERIRKFLRYGMLSSFCIGLFFFLLAEFMPVGLVNLFVSDSAVVSAMAARGLRIYAISFVFMAFSIIVGIYFQSKTMPVRSIMVLLGRSAAFPVLTVYLLSVWMKGFNVWIAIPIGEGTAMLMSIVLLKFENHQELLSKYT